MIEELYHATIRGRKTQTRRSSGLEVVNGISKKVYGPQLPPDAWLFHIPFALNKTMRLDNPNIINNRQSFLLKGPFQQKLRDEKKDHYIAKPRYKVGEVLYIKEPWRQPAPGTAIWYKYNMIQRERECYKWNNKLFMPESAARAFVKITDIKCERLLDISYSDCRAEGIQILNNWETKIAPYPSDEFKIYGLSKYDGCKTIDAKESFLSLYKFANKVKEVPNLWVWAYTFELVKTE